MCHRHIPFVAIMLAALLSVSADKPKESTPSPEQIQKWVKQLGDDSFKVREEATRDLIKAGRVTIDAVTKATKSKDAEVKQRALRIIKQYEKNAIAYVEKLGGKVTVDKKSPGKPVIELVLWRTNVTDAGLVHLKRFTNLRALYLHSTKVTDLSPLAGLTNLERLYLDKTQVSDLSPLKGLTNLERLDLRGTLVSDLSPLEGLTSLNHLSLQKTQVSGEEVQKLRKALPNCFIDWDPK